MAAGPEGLGQRPNLVRYGCAFLQLGSDIAALHRLNVFAIHLQARCSRLRLTKSALSVRIWRHAQSSSDSYAPRPRPFETTAGSLAVLMFFSTGCCVFSDADGKAEGDDCLIGTIFGPASAEDVFLSLLAWSSTSLRLLFLVQLSITLFALPWSAPTACWLASFSANSLCFRKMSSWSAVSFFSAASFAREVSRTESRKPTSSSLRVWN